MRGNCHRVTLSLREWGNSVTPIVIVFRLGMLMVKFDKFSLLGFQVKPRDSIKGQQATISKQQLSKQKICKSTQILIKKLKLKIFIDQSRKHYFFLTDIMKMISADD